MRAKIKNGLPRKAIGDGFLQITETDVKRIIDG